MFKEKAIYSRRFPIPTIEDLEAEMNEANDTQKYKPRYATGEEFIDHLLNDSKYVPIPERLERKKGFIKKVIDLSQIYEIDTDIKECEGYILATIYIVPSLFTGGIKERFDEAFCMADDISFFLSNDEPDKIILCLSYYTHDHYISGKKIRTLN